MTIDAVTGRTGANVQTSSAAAPGSTGKTTLDYSAFLKLLIAQMQNQDPLEPMKSSDYVAQLATFSQVEKSVEMNGRISDLLSAVQLQRAGDLIGQMVTSADGQTSGRVVAAKIVDGNVVAILAGGREIAVGTGAVIGGAAS